MAHYALIDENNLVVNVITGRDEDEIVDGISDWEEYYGNFFNLTCKRTSYNTFANKHQNNGIPFRKNFAEIGGTYDSEKDAFTRIKIFDSWIFDEDTSSWKAPVPKPDNENNYGWDEQGLNWVLEDIVAS